MGTVFAGSETRTLNDISDVVSVILNPGTTDAVCELLKVETFFTATSTDWHFFRARFELIVGEGSSSGGVLADDVYDLNDPDPGYSLTVGSLASEAVVETWYQSPAMGRVTRYYSPGRRIWTSSTRPDLIVRATLLDNTSGYDGDLGVVYVARQIGGGN